MELLYSEKCPGHQNAMELLKEIIKEEGVSADLRSIEVHNNEEAKRMRFLGSPTIRIEGEDVDPTVKGYRDYAVRCRTYSVEGGEQAWPSAEMIRRAIKRVQEAKIAASP